MKHLPYNKKSCCVTAGIKTVASALSLIRLISPIVCWTVTSDSRQYAHHESRHTFRNQRFNHLSSHDSLKNSNPLTENGNASTVESVLPHDYPYLSYIHVALAAVRKASRFAVHLQPEYDASELTSGAVLSKTDSSPVTVADFGVQSITLNYLNQSHSLHNNTAIGDTTHNQRPVSFIAEEGSTLLEENPQLAEKIIHLFDSLPNCFTNDIKISSISQLKTCIDLGKTYDETTGRIKTTFDTMNSSNLIWCLDPIDGTKGFLRGRRSGGQYCIALALIEDGIPVVGILCCPNLPVDASVQNFEWSPEETEDSIGKTRGCIFLAARGAGCYQLPLYPPSTSRQDVSISDPDSSIKGAYRVHATKNDGISCPSSKVRFCIAVERKNGDPYGRGIEMARLMHGTLASNGDILYCKRLDSQVKYGLIARGSAEVFFRLPKADYVEWIWDHAPGKVVIEEAGGLQTDTAGRFVDYSQGARLDSSVKGILASCGGMIHKELLEAYASA